MNGTTKTGLPAVCAAFAVMAAPASADEAVLVSASGGVSTFARAERGTSVDEMTSGDVFSTLEELPMSEFSLGTLSGVTAEAGAGLSLSFSAVPLAGEKGTMIRGSLGTLAAASVQTDGTAVAAADADFSLVFDVEVLSYLSFKWWMLALGTNGVGLAELSLAWPDGTMYAVSTSDPNGTQQWGSVGGWLPVGRYVLAGRTVADGSDDAMSVPIHNQSTAEFECVILPSPSAAVPLAMFLGAVRRSRGMR